MSEKIINIKPENVSVVKEFLDKSYDCVGYGGGLTTIEKIYYEGISFRTIDKSFFSKYPKEYQIAIKSKKNFTKKTLDKLTEIATK